ncbi:MAG: SOS response-associated peptidase family protein [Gordonibacter sp.]
MCGRFTMLTYDEVLDIVRSIEFGTPLNPEPEWPARGSEAFPGSMVPLIVPGENRRLEVAEFLWGYPVSWQKSVVFNTRIESALACGGMWSDSLRQRRCIVPTLGFCEPHRSETFRNPRTGRACKQQYRFTLPGSPLALLAGVYESNYFSVVTTEPNDNVSPIHDRMPLVLRNQEVPHWLGSNYADLADRSAVELSPERVVVQRSAQDGPDKLDNPNDQLSLF